MFYMQCSIILGFERYLVWDSLFFQDPKYNVIDINDMLLNDLSFGFKLRGKPVDLYDNEYFALGLEL